MGVFCQAVTLSARQAFSERQASLGERMPKVVNADFWRPARLRMRRQGLCMSVKYAPGLVPTMT